MYLELEKRLQELENEATFIKTELITAFDLIRNDPKTSLASTRRALEMLLHEIYRIENTTEPIDKNGKLMMIEDLLNSLKQHLDKRMFVRMKTVQNMGNMGAHPQEEDPLINEKDVLYSLDSLCDVIVWFLAKYKNRDTATFKYSQRTDDRSIRNRSIKYHKVQQQTTNINNTFSGNIYGSVNAGIGNIDFNNSEDDDLLNLNSTTKEAVETGNIQNDSSAVMKAPSDSCTEPSEEEERKTSPLESKIVKPLKKTENPLETEIENKDNRMYSHLHNTSTQIINYFNGNLTGPVNSGLTSALNLNSEVHQNGLKIYDIDSKIINKIIDVYEEIPEFDQARKILSENGVLLLYSDKHTGKYTTSIALLLDLQVENISQIFTESNLHELESIEIKNNTGYVLEGLTIQNTTLINQRLKYLGNKFIEHSSYLIITATQPNSMCEWSIHCTEPTDMNKVFENYLLYYFDVNDKFNDIQNQINNKRCMEKIQQSLKISEVENIVVGMKDKIGLTDWDKFIFSNLDEIARQHIKDWFKTHNNNDDFALLLSLAVFEGLSFERIKSMAEELKEVINNCFQYDAQAVGNKERLNYKESLFSKTVSEKLKEINAVMFRDYENSEYGRNQIDCTRFESEKFAPIIIEYVWKEFDTFRNPFILWLREAGTIFDQNICNSVAKTAAILSKFDFTLVFDQVIEFWANHKSIWIRQAAVYTIDYICEEQSKISDVSRIVSSWASRKYNYELNWTAAASYGNNLGIVRFDNALKDLHTISELDTDSFPSIVWKSMGYLLMNCMAMEANYDRILNMLYEWAKKPAKESNPIKPLLIFLRISDYIYIGEKGKKVPLMSLLLKNRKIKINYISKLFIRSLMNSDVRNTAYKVMGRWLSSGEKNEEMGLELEKWLVEMLCIGNNAERIRLYYCLDYCVRNKNIKSKIAEKIITEYINSREDA